MMFPARPWPAALVLMTAAAGQESEGRLAALLERLSDRREAAAVVTELARGGSEIVPSLTAELARAHGDGFRCAMLARALGRIGAGAAAAAPALAAALEGAGANLQAEVFAALGEIGPAAVRVVPGLRERLAAHEPKNGFASDERAITLAILARTHAIQPDELIAAVAQVHGADCVAACRAVIANGCESAAAQAALRDAHERAARIREEGSDWDLRAALELARAVLACCRDRAARISAHRTMLVHFDPDLRLASALSLRDLAGGDPGITLMLASVLQDTDPRVTRAALEGLGQCGDEALFVLPELDDWRYQKQGDLIAAARQAAAMVRERLTPAGRDVDAFMRGRLQFEDLVGHGGKLAEPIACALLRATSPRDRLERMVQAARWLRESGADSDLVTQVLARWQGLEHRLARGQK